MSKTSNRQNSVRVKKEELSLKNEGTRISLDYEIIDGYSRPKGIAIDHLPAPEKTFTADSADIVFIEDTVRLIFWMSKRYGKGARGLVEIVMTTASLAGFVATLGPVTNEVVKSSPLKPLEEEPSNSIALSANFVRVGSSDYTSVFDFFYASAMSMHPSQQNENQMYIKSIVRIETTASVFFGVVNKLKGIN